jgi:predicted ABC-type ATPase
MLARSSSTPMKSSVLIRPSPRASAGRELLRRLDAAVTQPVGFAVETTLSSLMYARRIPGWKAKGFTVSVYFLEVASADFAVARVAQRVANGGHGIPEADTRRRFARGLTLFPAYQQLADSWYHFRVGQGGSVLVDFKDP